MIRGISATVIRPTSGGVDAYGAPIPGEPERLPVENVLVLPSTTEEIEATARAWGVRTELTLHFPKTWTEGLRGCSIELPAPWGGPWEVIGDPMPLMDENCPTQWHMPVSVKRVDG